ncbi:DUF2459 domain-containing protein [Balneolaceae bacterium ANBcel3]|nr:DUF2459 domain-containing protein [Balneolaceae bacterium ANBcel3]
MRLTVNLFWVAIVPLLVCGCLGPARDIYPEEPQERPIPVYVVKIGWHAGLIVKSEYLSSDFPDHEKMPAAEWIKVGWGDDKYYPDPSPPVWVGTRAVLWPSRSVLHIVGIDIPVETYFEEREIVLLHVSEEGMVQISEFIERFFRRDDQGLIQYHSDGRYGYSAFFKARSRYYFPKTSNVWTARALRSAGMPVTPFYAVTAGNVLRQVRKMERADQEKRQTSTEEESG